MNIQHHYVEKGTGVKMYRVIALDTRGHGKTARGNPPLYYSTICRGFMPLIALIFAMKYPERVNRLILNGANLNGKGVKPSVQIPIIIGYQIASLFAGKSEDAKKMRRYWDTLVAFLWESAVDV